MQLCCTNQVLNDMFSNHNTAVQPNMVFAQLHCSSILYQQIRHFIALPSNTLSQPLYTEPRVKKQSMQFCLPNNSSAFQMLTRPNATSLSKLLFELLAIPFHDPTQLMAPCNAGRARWQRCNLLNVALNAWSRGADGSRPQISKKRCSNQFASFKAPSLNYTFI